MEEIGDVSDVEDLNDLEIQRRKSSERTSASVSVDHNLRRHLRATDGGEGEGEGDEYSDFNEESYAADFDELQEEVDLVMTTYL